MMNFARLLKELANLRALLTENLTVTQQALRLQQEQIEGLREENKNIRAEFAVLRARLIEVGQLTH